MLGARHVEVQLTTRSLDWLNQVSINVLHATQHAPTASSSPAG